MGKRTLQIIIEAGAKTCASKPGTFCPWIRTTHFGTRWVCGLFDHHELFDEHGTQEGWLQRLPECLAAERRRR